MFAYSFPIFYLICSILFSLCISIYAWRNPQGRAAKSFSIAALTSVLWMTGDIIERLSRNFAGQWTGQAICFLGVCFLPAAMLAFICEYCGKPLNRRRIVLLCVIPAVSWLTMVTDPYHHFFYSRINFVPYASARTEYGLYFWAIHFPYCYALSLAGFAAVLMARQRASAHFRPQITILFFALCIPLTVNALGVFKLFGEAADTPFSFPFFFSIMAIAVFRFRFLKSNPIAYETVFQTIRDGVIVLDPENIITDINPAAAKSIGKTPGTLIGASVKTAFAPWKEFLEKYNDTPLSRDLRDEIKLSLRSRERYISISITPLKDRRGAVDGRIVMLRDVTDSKNYQLSLETMAFYDPLTRLANRRKFLEEVKNALTKKNKTGKKIALLYFDLNHFKTVNDTMGHAVGDELLKYVGTRVSSVLRAPDLIARLGGDEFAILLHACDRENVCLLVERILSNVQRPFKIGKHILAAKLSIGAAFYPENGLTVTELIQSADAAMYEAKRGGGGLCLSENFSLAESSQPEISSGAR